MPIPLVIVFALIVIGLSNWIVQTKNHWGILGISFIVGISIFGVFFFQSRQSETNLRVVGYASKLFDSDLVKWNLSLQRSVSTGELKSGYSNMSKDIAAFKGFLVEKGIPVKDINIQPVTSFPMFDHYGSLSSYNINQNVFILSNDLDKIEQLSLNPDFFADRGILLQNSQLEYLYSKLPELKKQLLAEATTDAVERAKEISSSAKVRLGKMREARAGVFQITAPYSQEVSDYGIYNTSTRQKSISVTLTSVFDLK